MESSYRVDQKRRLSTKYWTNVLVHAWDDTARRTVEVDIAKLDKDSFIEWLRADDGRAERLVLRLLGHE